MLYSLVYYCYSSAGGFEAGNTLQNVDLTNKLLLFCSELIVHSLKMSYLIYRYQSVYEAIAISAL